MVVDADGLPQTPSRDNATSNQAVMSALPSPERSIKIGISAADRARAFTFGCGVSLVIYWSDHRGAVAFTCPRRRDQGITLDRRTLSSELGATKRTEHARRRGKHGACLD
jgi:hypothetical protein